MLSKCISNLLDASELGLPSASSGSIGQKVLGFIKDVGGTAGLVVGVVAVIIVAITIMATRKQEARTEAMTRILWIAGGIALISFAFAGVGFFASSFGLN